MKFKRRVTLEQGLNQINMAPLIDCIFLLQIFFLLTYSFAAQTGINVKLPKAVTSDAIKEENLIVTITSEDVIYLRDNVVTLDELKAGLQGAEDKKLPVLIKSDRRSSMGRIVDVWDICRELGLEKINIATNRDER